MRNILFGAAMTLLAATVWGQGAAPQMDAEQRAIFEKRYGPLFYGVELPDKGARVLLVLDTSRSMASTDPSRTDGGCRWDTLVDEVAKMTESMQQLVATKHVCYTVSILYEGGDGHSGTEPFDLSQSGAADRLLEELRKRDFTPGGSFDHTFGKALWPLVSRQHITHIFYLGDDDIGRWGTDTARETVKAWYTLPRKDPSGAQRALWRLKTEWWKPWGQRRRSARGAPSFKQELRLPPPPRDVIFSCIAIGQESELLKELSKIGHGKYVERIYGR